ncbi:MAG: preprotein translocase subunit SecE [Holosporales bacterium]
MAKVTPVQFLQQVKQEVTKVTWPTRKETMVTCVMVGVLSVIAALFFLAVDGSIAFIMSRILG